jgi:hypothetical protein
LTILPAASATATTSKEGNAAGSDRAAGPPLTHPVPQHRRSPRQPACNNGL